VELRLDATRPATTVAMSGFADDREGAKAALIDNWSRWLAVARLARRLGQKFRSAATQASLRQAPGRGGGPSPRDPSGGGPNPHRDLAVANGPISGRPCVSACSPSSIFTPRAIAAISLPA